MGMRLAGPALAVGIAVVVGWAWPRIGASAQTNGPDARTTYLADCASCHGADATGTTRAPSLVGVGAASVDFELSTGRMPLAVASRDESDGREPRPAPQRTPADASATPRRHAPAYSADVIRDLIGYVQELTGGAGPAIPAIDAGDVARGGELYRLNCAACHSWAGTGGALIKREAPDLLEATRVQTAEAIRVGPGRMPAFGRAAFTDQQVEDVAAYVQEIQAPEDRGGTALDHLGPVAEGAAAGGAIVLLLLVLRVIGERG